MIYRIFFCFALFADIIHPIVFSSYNKWINYNPHTIDDYVNLILPNTYVNMYLFDNYVFLSTLMILVMFQDENIFKSFVLSRTVRSIAIYLVKIPNPNVNAHLNHFKVHDLIISGHTITWNLIYMYVYNNYNIYISNILLFLLILYYWYIIKEKKHYSVDVFLGLYISYTSYLLCKNNIKLLY